MPKLELASYYEKRANEYEIIYHKPERQTELRKLEAILQTSFSNLNVLEIACGTGYWTQFLAKSAKSIVAMDYNQAVIDVANQKDYGNCPVSFIQDDAYSLNKIEKKFNAAVVGFWWSHIAKDKQSHFLDALHAKLTPDAKVIILDNRYVEGSSTAISRIDEYGNSYQVRHLNNGNDHEIIKNFPTEGELLKSFSGQSKNLKYQQLDYFWLFEYTFK